MQRLLAGRWLWLVVRDGAGEPGFVAWAVAGVARVAEHDKLGGEVSDAGQLLELGRGPAGSQGPQVVSVWKFG